MFLARPANRRRRARGRSRARSRRAKTSTGGDMRGLYGVGCAVALAAAGCGPVNEKARVHIEYEQVADFSEFRLSSDSNDSHGIDDGLFVMYRIKKIDNSGAQAKKFVL